MAEHAFSTPTPAPGEPTRRRLMSALSGAAFAGTALAIAAPPAEAANPDAELIAACKRFAHLEQDYARLCRLTDWPDGHILTPEEQALQEEFEDVSDEQHEIGDWLAEQHPQTEAGLKAKARSVLLYGGHSTADMISRLTVSLVRDVAGETGA